MADPNYPFAPKGTEPLPLEFGEECPLTAHDKDD